MPLGLQSPGTWRVGKEGVGPVRFLLYFPRSHLVVWGNQYLKILSSSIQGDLTLLIILKAGPRTLKHLFTVPSGICCQCSPTTRYPFLLSAQGHIRKQHHMGLPCGVKPHRPSEIMVCFLTWQYPSVAVSSVGGHCISQVSEKQTARRVKLQGL